MKISKRNLRLLIEKYLLLEEISGKKGIVYHGSSLNPFEFREKLESGQIGSRKNSSVNAFGYGLYTFYDIKTANQYGTFLYKLEVNLEDYICFVVNPCIEVYGEELTIREQLSLNKNNKEEVEKMIEAMENNDQAGVLDMPLSKIDSPNVKLFNQYGNFVVPGIIFRDSEGKNCLIHDSRTVVPLAYQISKIGFDPENPSKEYKVKKSTVDWERDEQGNIIMIDDPEDGPIPKGTVRKTLYEPYPAYTHIRGGVATPVYNRGPRRDPSSPEFDKNQLPQDFASGFSTTDKYDHDQRFIPFEDIDKSILMKKPDPLSMSHSKISMRAFGKYPKKENPNLMPHRYIPKKTK